MMEKKSTTLPPSNGSVITRKLRKLQYVALWIGIGVLVLITLIVMTPFNDLITLPLIIDEPPVAADVIIVLGSGVKKDGEIGMNGEERVIQGAILWSKGYANTLLMSGGKPENRPFIESEQMAAYAASLGVPYDNVALETSSRSTWENASYSKSIMEQNNWDNAIVVTSRFHSRRACKVFEKQEFEVTCVAVEKNLIPRIAPIDRLNNFRSIIREYGATVYYLLKGYI